MIRATLLLAILMTASGAAAQASVQGPAAGCYDLRVPSAPDLLPSADSIFLALPPRIELDTLPGSSSLGAKGFALRAAPGALPSIHEHTWWEWADPERLSLVWLTSKGGVSMELFPTPGGLRGTLTAIWDHPRSGPVAGVEATRVDCGAPLPAEQRAVYRLSRGIELESGDSVRIGEPLPPDLPGSEPLEPGLSRVTAVAGLFAGADEARVATDEGGVVRSIRLLYPGGSDYRELAGRLMVLHGPPASRVHPPDPRGGAEWWAWQSRMVGITVWNAVSADGTSQVTVLLRDPRF